MTMTTIPTTSSSTQQIAQQIKTLLKTIKKNETANAARLDELRRLFGQLHSQGHFAKTKNNALQSWQSFLNTSFQTFLSQLKHAMIQNNSHSAVRTMFGVIASCPSTTETNLSIINVSLLEKWISCLIQANDLLLHKSILTMIQGEFIHSFIDVQYYAWVAISNLAKHPNHTVDETERLFQILTMIPNQTTQTDLDNGSVLFHQDVDDGDDDDNNNNSDDNDVDDDDDSQENTHDNHDDDDASSESEQEDEPSTKRQKRTMPQKKRLFDYQKIKSHRRVMSTAWLSILQLNLSTLSLKQALVSLPLKQVSEPLLFSNFYTQAFDHGGVLAILALEGLFILLTKHHLEYPDFYSKLYSLIQPSYTKYRNQLFPLLTKALIQNQMISATLVASFCKRLLRCSLSSPPYCILVSLALVGNLIQQHAEVACLIHRTCTTSTMNEDVFDATTDHVTQTRALESSLWELHALSHHYYPAVATLAKAIGTISTANDLPLNVSDHLTLTYKSLFDQARKQKNQKVALTFHEPSELFSEQHVLTGIVAFKK